MSNKQSSFSCMLGCWGLGVLAGILAAILLMVLGDWRLIQAIFAGIVIAIILGALISWIACKPLPAGNDAAIRAQASTNPMPTNAESASAAASAAKGGATAAAVAGTAAAAAAAAKTGVKPSASLDGEAELADRKGEWKYEGDASSKSGAATASAPASLVSETPETTASAPAAKKPAAKKASAAKKTDAPKKSAVAKKPATAKTAAKSSGAAAGSVSTSKAASSKSAGSGKASGGKTASGAAETTAKSTSSSKAAAKSATGSKSAAKADTGSKAAASKPARKPVAKDGQPELLKKARAGGADDLKMIKGVGPGLEKTLNELGFWHFDQIAGWRKKEVEWVDARLKFKGRIERDEWIKQAKTLAKGGSTEFAKRVKKGGVY